MGRRDDYVDRHVGAGKRRRLPAAAVRRRTYLDSAEAIRVLLDAARELDAERRRGETPVQRCKGRRPLEWTRFADTRGFPRPAAKGRCPTCPEPDLRSRRISGREAIELLRQGRTPGELAESLGVSPQTHREEGRGSLEQIAAPDAAACSRAATTSIAQIAETSVARAAVAADRPPAGQRPSGVDRDRVRAGHRDAVAPGAQGDRLLGGDRVAAAA